MSGALHIRTHLQRRARGTAALMRVTVALLLLVPIAAAASGPRAAIVVYHPDPDPRTGEADADPFSAPGVRPGLALPSLPSTRFDGIAIADAAPEGHPESGPAHLREMQRQLDARAATGASVELSLAARVDADAVIAALDARPIGERPLRLHLALVEDGVPATGAEGVVSYRFVARAIIHSDGEGTRLDARMPLAAGWSRERLSVVGWAEDASTSQTLQAVVARADGALVVQVSKLVLIERASATWCAPCSPGDEALSLLASGIPDTGVRDRYLRAPDVWAAAGLALGGSVALLALRGRRA